MNDRYIGAYCEEGHWIDLHVSPGKQIDKFCGTCSSKVLTKCPACSAELKGMLKSGVVETTRRFPANYCHECAEPYPWTLHAAERAKRAIDLHAAEESVAAEDVEALKAFTDDVARGTASADDIRGIMGVLKKFGGAAPVIWNQVKDIGTTVVSKTMAEIYKSYIGP